MWVWGACRGCCGWSGALGVFFCGPLTGLPGSTPYRIRSAVPAGPWSSGHLCGPAGNSTRTGAVAGDVGTCLDALVVASAWVIPFTSWIPLPPLRLRPART